MKDQKITSDHLRKTAYLYVRQSSMRQVIENKESTKRQYALKNRALALGWSLDQIIVIDEDCLEPVCRNARVPAPGSRGRIGACRIGHGPGSIAISTK